MSKSENIELTIQLNIEEDVMKEQVPSEIPHEEGEVSNPEENDAVQAPSPFLKALMAELDQCSDPEGKLQRVIAFMESSLAQTGTPHFKSFWEARKLCLPLFKEHINPASRSTLWDKYTELSKEARRLKELLNEQSAFAEEQISIAIQALENDLDQLEKQDEDKTIPTLPINCMAIADRHDAYSIVQYTLDRLNACASRINALRKELIKTEMRVRKKNQFFQRLSAAGDRVFPRRKEMIKEVSQQFTSDVDSFVSTHFNPDHPSQESPFTLREEIKSLQGLAKLLTLNAQSFTHTRMRLSECWDQLKELDKERKQQRAEKKVLFKQNLEAVQQKIDEVNQGLQSGELKPAQAEEKLSEITAFMRRVDLGREELQILRDQISNVRKPIMEKRDQEAQARQQQERERVQLKQQKFLDLRQEVEALISGAASYDLDGLVAARNEMQDKIQSAPIPKAQKEELERIIKSLRDVIVDKKEQGLLALSDDDRQALQQLQDVLRQRKERRQEIKDQLESLRKSSGSSGYDFERAMQYQQQMDEEKERLEQINHGIDEIEGKIAILKRKL